MSLVGYLLTRSLGQAIIMPNSGAILSNKRPNTIPELVKKSVRLLCCAPSNAACDEMVRRLKQGVIQRTGIKLMPKVVRLGSSDAINADVKDVTLELLVEESFTKGADYKKFIKNSTASDAVDQEYRDKLVSLDLTRDRIRKEESDPSNDTQRMTDLNIQMRLNTQKRKEVLEAMQIARDSKSSDSKALDLARRAARKRILMDADVV